MLCEKTQIKNYVLLNINDYFSAAANKKTKSYNTALRFMDYHTKSLKISKETQAVSP